MKLEESLAELNKANDRRDPDNKTHFDHTSITLDDKGFVKIYSGKGYNGGYYEEEKSIEYLLQKDGLIQFIQSFEQDRQLEVDCRALRKLTNWWKDSSYQDYETNADDSIALGSLTGKISITNKIIDLTALTFEPDPNYQHHCHMDYYDRDKVIEFSEIGSKFVQLLKGEIK